MEKKIVSIIELLDTHTGKTKEVLRVNGRVEAPFFRGSEELYYNGGGLIYRYSLEDGSITQVPTGYCIRCNNDHVLSPCGKYLAVSHDSEEDYASRIYILPLDGSAPPRKVTPLPFSYLHGWSPDGKTLSYCASRGGEFDVYVIPAEGGEERRLTFAPGLDGSPKGAAKGAHAVQKFLTSHGVSEKLSDLGFTENDVPVLTELAMNTPSLGGLLDQAPTFADRVAINAIYLNSMTMNP